MSNSVEDAADLRRWDAQWLKYQDAGMKMKNGSMTVTGCVAAEALARIKWAAADITLISRADACASPYEEPVGAMTPQGGQ